MATVDEHAERPGKLPEQMTVAELKVWLESRGAPTKGKKGDLIDRQAE